MAGGRNFDGCLEDIVPSVRHLPRRARPGDGSDVGEAARLSGEIVLPGSSAVTMLDCNPHRKSQAHWAFHRTRILSHGGCRVSWSSSCWYPTPPWANRLRLPR